MSNIQAVEDRIIVRPDPLEEETSSGLLVVHDKAEKPVVGTVMSVGPGRYSEAGTLVPTDFAVDDRVYYSRFGGNALDLPEERLIVLRPGDILAKAVD